MDYLNSELITPKEKEGFTSCHSPKGEDRKEPQFDILLREQGGVNSLIDKRSQINSIFNFNNKKERSENEKVIF